MDEGFNKPINGYTDINRIRLMLGGEEYLPTVNNEPSGVIDNVRINNAIEFATSIINTYLTLETAQNCEAVASIATNLAIWQISDMVTSSEAQRQRYEDSMKLLEKIAKNSNQGLGGKGLQQAEIVEPAKDLAFKKGFLL